MRDAQAGVPSAVMASGATCVQRLDGSRDSAIHTKYRISLRSSSMREPRYPLPRVVKVKGITGSPRPPATGVPVATAVGASRLHCSLAPNAPGYCSAPPDPRRGGGGRVRGSPPVRAGEGDRSRPPAVPHERVDLFTFVCSGLDNDPSAGSPTETLLRLLLPLNDKVQ
jgi:hypothetical protein